MNVKTPVSPPSRSNKILSQIQQHSQLIAQISNRKDDLFPAGTRCKNASTDSRSSSKLSSVPQGDANNILLNCNCSTNIQTSKGVKVVETFDIVLDADKSSESDCDSAKIYCQPLSSNVLLKNDLLMCSDSAKVFSELTQLESVLLSTVKNISSLDDSNISESSSLGKANTSCDLIIKQSTDHLSNVAVKKASHDIRACISNSCHQKPPNHQTSISATDCFEEDSIDWRNRCFLLEKQLSDFKTKAGRIRQLMHEKLQDHEFRVHQATRRAEIAEEKLRRFHVIDDGEKSDPNKPFNPPFNPPSSSINEVQIVSYETKRENKLKRSRDVNNDGGDDDNDDDDDNKDAIISHLQLQIETYQEHERLGILRVEEHSKKIRDWVATKFQQLESRNVSLLSERNALANKVEILKEKLLMLEHQSSSVKSPSPPTTTTTTTTTTVDDDDAEDIIDFTSEYFHNKSPDTDEETLHNDDYNDTIVNRQKPKCSRTVPEVKIERKVFPKDLALSFMSSCDESQTTDVNTSRSSVEDAQFVLKTSNADLRPCMFKSEDHKSKTDDLIQKFLAMSRADSNHTVSALATMPRCKATERSSAPDQERSGRSKNLKLMTIDRNFRSSSIAPQEFSKPPTVPLRRVPSWEKRIYEIASSGLRISQRKPAALQSSPSKVILFYEQGGCLNCDVPVYAVCQQKTIKISNSPIMSNQTKLPVQRAFSSGSATDVNHHRSHAQFDSSAHHRRSFNLSSSNYHQALTSQPESIFSLSSFQNRDVPVSTPKIQSFSKERTVENRNNDKKEKYVTEKLLSDKKEKYVMETPSSEKTQLSSKTSKLSENFSNSSQNFKQNFHQQDPKHNSSSDNNTCIDRMTTSDTSSDYALPPDDNDSNLGFSCRLEEEEFCHPNFNDRVSHHEGRKDDNGHPARKSFATADDDSLWDLFDEVVIKCGWLLHLKEDIRSWQECWCVFSSGDFKLYTSQFDRKPSVIFHIDEDSKVSQHENIFHIEVQNQLMRFASSSVSISHSWVQALTEHKGGRAVVDGSYYKCSFKQDAFSSWLTKIKNGQSEKCWCVLADETLHFFKNPKSQWPYMKLALNEFRIEELDSIGVSSSDSLNSTENFYSVIVLWPSHPSSSSSFPHYDSFPVYLQIPIISIKVNWFHSLLKVTSSSSHASHSKHVTEYEQNILKLMFIDGDPASNIWKDPALCYSKSPISKPLTSHFSENLSKKALDMFKYILNFTSLPVDWNELDTKLVLVQKIFSLCHHHLQLRNELFCQLIKQTTRPQQQQKSLGNFLCGGHHWFLCDTSPTSPMNSTIETSDLKSSLSAPHHLPIIQGWQLLTMALHLFLPNKLSILWMLRKHLQRNADSRSECGKYAVYCQCAMERVELNGSRNHPPSHLEVLSVLSHNPYHHSQPISIPVHFSNSSYQVVSFDGSTLVKEFLQNLNKSIAMRDNTLSGFALYACDSSNSQQEVCCLDLNAKICDILSCLEVKFSELNSKRDSTCPTIKLLYRNRLYFKSLCRYESEKERLLHVFQIHGDIVAGRFPVSEDLAVEMVALIAQMEYGDMKVAFELKATSTQGNNSPHHQQQQTSHLLFISQVLERLLPKFVLQQTVEPSKLEHLENKLMESWSRLKGKGVVDCVKVYLAVVRKWMYCGTRMVPAKVKLEATAFDDVWFCVHEDGISILELMSLKPLYSFNYKLIVTFGGYDEYMSIVIKRNIHSPLPYKRFLFAMTKSEAQEVTLLMADYIRNKYQLRTSLTSKKC